MMSLKPKFRKLKVGEIYGVLGMKDDVFQENKYTFYLLSCIRYVSKKYYLEVFVYNLEKYYGGWRWGLWMWG